MHAADISSVADDIVPALLAGWLQSVLAQPSFSDILIINPA